VIPAGSGPDLAWGGRPPADGYSEGRARDYQPARDQVASAGPFWPRTRSRRPRAGTGHPLRRWTEVFPITPATLLSWHGSRRMHLGGLIEHPTGEWTVQQARNLALGERFEDIRFLLRDRGSNFTASFDAVFQATGTRVLCMAAQAPRVRAMCERPVGTLRRELLVRVLILQ
jgi:hypothetical protein